jgi:hypothetical protein
MIIIYLLAELSFGFFYFISNYLMLIRKSPVLKHNNQIHFVCLYLKPVNKSTYFSYLLHEDCYSKYVDVELERLSVKFANLLCQFVFNFLKILHNLQKRMLCRLKFGRLCWKLRFVGSISLISWGLSFPF